MPDFVGKTVNTPQGLIVYGHQEVSREHFYKKLDEALQVIYPSENEESKHHRARLRLIALENLFQKRPVRIAGRYFFQEHLNTKTHGNTKLHDEN